MNAPPRVLRALLIVASGLVAVAVAAGATLAGPAAERSRDHAVACRVAVEQLHVEPTSETHCVLASRGLGALSVVPWTRESATETRLLLEDVKARHQLYSAVVVRADGPARTEAARAVWRVASARSRSFEPQVSAARLAYRYGAHDVVIEVGRQFDEVDAREHALAAALQLGDVDAAVRAARQPANAGDRGRAAEYDLRRAALLCLVDRRNEGKRILDGLFANPSARGRLPVDAARMACGGPLPPAAEWSAAEASTLSLALADRTRDDEVLPMFVSPSRLGKRWAWDRTPFLARALIADSGAEANPLEIVAQLRPAAQVRGPWELLPRKAVFEDHAPTAFFPADLEAAANRVEALADQIRSGDDTLIASCPKTKPAGIRCAPTSSHDDLPCSLYQLCASPSDGLHAIAARLRLHAAETRSRMGQAKRASDLAWTIVEHNPSRKELSWALAVLMSAGDWQRARTAVDAHVPHLHDGKPDAADVAAAWVDMHDRRWDDVRARLRRGLLIGPHGDATTWLALAAEAAAGRSVDLALPGGLDWKQVVKEFGPWQLPSAGPAAMYVIAREAPPAGDTEVWLDHFVADYDPLFTSNTLTRYSNQQPYVGAIRYARIRAEVARYRGDRSAESRWHARANKLLALQKDPHSSVLGYFAGL